MKHLTRRTAAFCILLVLSLFSTLLLAGCGEAATASNHVGQSTQDQPADTIPSLAAVWKTDTLPAFNFLTAMTIDSHDNIYVADAQHIYKYDSKGTLLLRWDNAGDQKSQFKRLISLATDSKDNLYAVDADNHALLKFDGNGKLLATVAGPQSSVGELKYPTDVALDRADNLFVADVSVGPREARGMATAPTKEARVQKLASGANGKFSLQPIGMVAPSNLSVRDVPQATTEQSGMLGLATDSQRNLYVMDQDYTQVRKFDANGRFVSTIGTYGNSNGQFLKPTSVSVDRQDNLYVIDAGRTINKFDSSGKFQVKWRGGFGKGGDTFINLSSMKIDSQGNFYTIDASNTIVQKFDPNGQIITRWGSNGFGGGHFQRPTALAIDSHKNIYVSDRDNFQVQKLDSTGHFLTKWGSYGSKPGQFQSPNQIAVDSHDNLYVGDSALGTIQKFDSNGNFITSFDGDYGILTIDSQDNIYALALSNRITVSIQNLAFLKYDTQGTLIKRVSNPLIERQGARYEIPQSLAVDSQGYVYMLSSAAMHKFDSNFGVVGDWGGEGNCDCHQMVIDNQDRLYELGNKLRVVGTDDGKLLGTWTLTGYSASGRVVADNGIMVDKQDNVYVSDYLTNNVVNFGPIKN